MNNILQLHVPYTADWWYANVKGFHPDKLEGVDMNKTEVQTLEELTTGSSATVLRHSLLAAGLSKDQADVVGRDGLEGLHAIMVAGGTGIATPVSKDSFLKVVNILFHEAGDDNAQDETLLIRGREVRREGHSG